MRDSAADGCSTPWSVVLTLAALFLVQYTVFNSILVARSGYTADDKLALRGTSTVYTAMVLLQSNALGCALPCDDVSVTLAYGNVSAAMAPTENIGTIRNTCAISNSVPNSPFEIDGVCTTTLSFDGTHGLPAGVFTFAGRLQLSFLMDMFAPVPITNDGVIGPVTQVVTGGPVAPQTFYSGGFTFWIDTDTGRVQGNITINVATLSG